LRKTSQAIVDLMLQSPGVTIPEHAQKFGRTKRAIELQINKLEEEGIVQRVGPADGGQWEVRQ
jgi:ATP-dependent DNA helicase RecG